MKDMKDMKDMIKKWLPLIALLIVAALASTSTFSTFRKLVEKGGAKPYIPDSQFGSTFRKLVGKGGGKEPYANINFIDDITKQNNPSNLIKNATLKPYNYTGTGTGMYVVPIFPTDAGSISNEVDDLGLDPSDSLCSSYGSNSVQLEKACSSLTAGNCMNSGCCTYVNGQKCVAGSVGGPTQLTDACGNMIPVDTYYYQNKCYDGPSSPGSCAYSKRVEEVCTAYTRTKDLNEWMCNVVGEYYKDKPEVLDANNMPCCVHVTTADGLTQGKAGNKFGPYFKTDASGNALVKGKYKYTHQKKCYGSGC